MAWLIIRAIRQRGLVPRLMPGPPRSGGDLPHVAVIVPARDEEANIGPCLECLLAQDYPTSRMNVLVVDDHSADRTAAIVSSLAARHSQRLALIASPPLPPRWLGKSHSCWIGARSVGSPADWLCFIDADVKLAPHALASAVDAALTRRLDLLSVMPRQELGSFAERLILPCGFILMSFVQHLRRLQARSAEEVTVTGQFMLICRDAYVAVGGHAAVCRAICEDLELARRVKQSGRAVLLMIGDALLSARMYTGWRTLWPGLAKNLIDTFGGPLATVTLALVSVLLAWAAVALPVLDIYGWRAGMDGAGTALILAAAGSAAAFGLHIAAAFYFRIPFWYGLIFPLGYTAGALMALDSLRRRLSGRVSWKGRIYS